MAHPSDPGFVVLHALRLKGFAQADAVATSTGLPQTEVDTLLTKALASEHVAKREGKVSGWSLTPQGRVAHVAGLAAELDATGARPTIETNYRRFLGYNAGMLALCTDWQMRNGTMNDHSDATYDTSVITRLAQTDEAIGPICADLTAMLSRFGRYGPRLRNARLRVEAGEHDWFTKPLLDSYHTVWFELHEDLLATLSITRGTEKAP